MNNVHSVDVPQLAFDALMGFYAVCRGASSCSGVIDDASEWEGLLKQFIERRSASARWLPGAVGDRRSSGCVCGRDFVDSGVGDLCNSVDGGNACQSNDTSGSLDGRPDALPDDLDRRRDGLRNVLKGPNGGCSMGRGLNYARNVRNRERKRNASREKRNYFDKKEGKKNNDFKEDSLSGDKGKIKLMDELKESSAKKWKIQNELAAEKAFRELQVLKENSIEAEVRRYRTRVSAATEKNMVSIEKTHGLLKSTGNVPGFHGSVETVVDGEIVPSNTPELTGGSISPDSSISQAEARKAQKDLLDAQSEVETLKGKLALITRKAGFSAEHFELYDKNTWTENDENEALLDELYPEGYVVNREYCATGKFQLQ